MNHTYIYYLLIFQLSLHIRHTPFYQRFRQPLAGFTAPWKKLTGPETALAPALRGALRGLRVHRGEFEALYPSDLPCPAGCREELADLQTVMVYLEREVETV